jgi:hypothetical protein
MRNRDLAGVGVVACVACCAGPILGFLGGLGVVGALSSPLVGVAGILVALGCAVVAAVLKRARARRCPVDEGPRSAPAPVPVELTRHP